MGRFFVRIDCGNIYGNNDVSFGIVCGEFFEYGDISRSEKIWTNFQKTKNK